MNKNSKIYIAGHRGLVGSAIWKNLQEKEFTNLIGKTSSELNLLNQQATENFFKKEQPEYVFLAAAKVGGIMANNTYRADFLYENLTIQNNVIHYAWKYGVKKLLFLGSTCIYPKNAEQPMKEDALLTSPLEYTNEPYAIAKIAGIKLCESYNLQYGTNFLSVMPTNLYGPNDNFDLEKSHVLPALLRKIHLGKCLKSNDWQAIRRDLNRRPIEGIDGSASEEKMISILNKYGIVISNEVRNLSKSGTRQIETDSSPPSSGLGMTATSNQKPETSNEQPETSNEHPETRNTHINIGTGQEISIKALAELISKTVGFKGELVFNTTKPDGTPRKLTDVTKLNNLGWHHQIEIEDGIKKVYEWYVVNNQ